MRKVKATSVRIGDFISTGYVRSSGGFIPDAAMSGTVDSIVHVGRSIADFHVRNESQTYVITLSIGHPTMPFVDDVWRD